MSLVCVEEIRSTLGRAWGTRPDLSITWREIGQLRKARLLRARFRMSVRFRMRAREWAPVLLWARRGELVGWRDS